MEHALSEIDKSKHKKKLARSNQINDSFNQYYYLNYYSDLSTKELDLEFRRDMIILTKTLSKLKDSERKIFISVLSKYIEQYINQKVEKEIDFSFMKIFKLL